MIAKVMYIIHNMHRVYSLPKNLQNYKLVQMENICTHKIMSFKICGLFLEEKKTLREKEKMITSIFYFSHMFSKGLIWISKDQGCVVKG